MTKNLIEIKKKWNIQIKNQIIQDQVDESTVGGQKVKVKLAKIQSKYIFNTWIIEVESTQEEVNLWITRGLQKAEENQKIASHIVTNIEGKYNYIFLKIMNRKDRSYSRDSRRKHYSRKHSSRRHHSPYSRSNYKERSYKRDKHY